MELYAVFLPLIGFLLTGLFGKPLGDTLSQALASIAVIVSAVLSVLIFINVGFEGAAYTQTLMTWMAVGDLGVDWSLRIDSLSAVMMVVITVVSACVHVYSIGYMSHDAARAKFFCYLNLFTFAMLMLVTSDNLLQLFFGWEGVGLASYLLIGFWNYKDSANAAAMKAFIVNRVGDFGLSLGIFACFVLFGSLQFDTIFEAVPAMADAEFDFLGLRLHALTLTALLLFIGAIGKSAQLGLHTWLPDAMEGPTPVSALIHAATMVTAGVFLVARFSPVFEYAPDALVIVTIVGALTAFVAATIGMTQFDIKRVIAYSTMSQLGYMFFALGVSAYAAAMFHLFTHAFFKALLFLGAGSVIHAMSDEQDMRKMGGIWKKIPITYGLMWIGSLALAGLPFFSGYYSKDLILEAAFADHSWFGIFAFWMGIAAALMTAFYSWRLLIMTFHGQPKADEKVMAHVHESPAVMILPMLVLAIGALFAGAVFYTPFAGGHGKAGHHAESMLAHEATQDDSHVAEATPQKEEHADDHGHDFWNGAIKVLPQNDTVSAAHHVPKWVKLLPIFTALTGIILAWIFYGYKPSLPGIVAKKMGVLHRFVFRRWMFDELYNAAFIKPSFWLGRIFWIKGDTDTIDRFGPNGFAALAQKIGKGFQAIQSGFIYHYAFIMLICVVGLITFVFARVMPGL